MKICHPRTFLRDEVPCPRLSPGLWALHTRLARLWKSFGPSRRSPGFRELCLQSLVSDSLGIRSEKCALGHKQPRRRAQEQLSLRPLTASPGWGGLAGSRSPSFPSGDPGPELAQRPAWKAPRAAKGTSFPAGAPPDVRGATIVEPWNRRETKGHSLGYRRMALSPRLCGQDLQRV